MKTFFKQFLVSLFLSVITIITTVAQTDSPPVIKLRELYNDNADFKITVDNMFKNLQTLSDGSENPWIGGNVEDLYTFFNDWYYFLPNKHNGLDRVIKFTFLFYNNPYGKQFILQEPGKSWSLYFVTERGKYMDSEESTKNIHEWLSDSSMNNEDFELPKEGFRSFNHFFTRNLKPGARHIDEIDDNAVIVSPADGIINMINNDLQIESQIPTKANMTLSLNELLDYSEYAENFVGGTALAVFLMPDNYHHYHAPVTGMLVESNEEVGDRLFGIPDILDMINNGNVAYNKDYSVFQNFRHGYFIFDTEEFGYVAIIPIGLQTVGSVVFENKYKNIDVSSAVKIHKGEKLGHFAYGGSTVLLLFEKGKLSSLSVQQGQQIGKLKN